MSFEALHERLTDLQETINQLKELIDRLENLKFQPGSVPLSADGEDNVAGELGSEISQVLGEAEEDLEMLQEEVLDFRGDRIGNSDGVAEQRARLKEGTARLARDLKSSRAAVRKAQLSARRSLEQARQLERRLLLASYSASAMNSPGNRSGASSPPPGQPLSPPPQQQQQQQLFTARDRRRLAQQAKDRGATAGGDDAAVSASSDVTAALRRTHALIADSVARSEFARQTLAESTAALGQLHNAYAGLDDMLASSRDLLGTLLSSQKSDTWYLQTALYLLLGTLAWLVFRRLLYGPLWWLVWLPLRLMWRSGKAVAHVGGGKGGARMQVGNVEERGSKVVRVGQEGAVPIAVVGEPKKETFGEPDSMVEKVGKLVDEATNEDVGIDIRGNAKLVAGDNNSAVEEDEGPNTEKRIREEKSGAAKQERAKDEL